MTLCWDDKVILVGTAALALPESPVTIKGRIFYPLSHNPDWGFYTHRTSWGCCYHRVRLVLEKGVIRFRFSVLGCSDPLSSTVCRVLPASSGSAPDLALLCCAARIPLPCNSRLPLRFPSWKKPITLQGILPLQVANSPNTPYLFLYLPILCHKICLMCQEQSPHHGCSSSIKEFSRGKSRISEG